MAKYRRLNSIGLVEPFLEDLKFLKTLALDIASEAKIGQRNAA